MPPHGVGVHILEQPEPACSGRDASARYADNALKSVAVAEARLLAMQ